MQFFSKFSYLCSKKKLIYLKQHCMKRLFILAICATLLGAPDRKSVV